ncbi:MAG: ornithine carbamoyltransferase [Desulfobacteraceae bacterium]|nr:MAG: ornithine carbamoyltransferase [Desulfobacteraceae bacterium]
MKKDIRSLLDLTAADFRLLMRRAVSLKEDRKRGSENRPLSGKTLGLVFEKASTRTRISFEAAMAQLGGSSIFISPKDTQMARAESVADTARILSLYLDAVVLRTYSQAFLEEFADAASIPVINGLTDLYHPCQVLSDLMTVEEKKGPVQHLKIAWVGDGNNMSHSWINAAGVLGLNLTLACPESYAPKSEVLDAAGKSGMGRIRVTGDPIEAVMDADVVNTDVWASMGQESESKHRKNAFRNFTVDSRLMSHAKGDAIVMHCLPVHRGEEITGEVLDGPQSVIWDQAENKLHMHKAVLEALIGS